MRIVVAMSGGVDSSVAAALVKEAGHEAVGVTMKLLPKLDTGFGCCGSPKDIEDAKRVCERLGIPHYVVDMAELFEKTVIAPFVDSYRNAETPNPCVECNRHVKFHHLLKLAEAWSAEKVATGHYARVDAQDGRYRLLRAVDEQKDQTYFLHTLTQSELGKAMFPVGDLTKSQVREKARELGLTTAEKKESFEICFVPNRDYRKFLDSRPSPSPLPSGEDARRAGEGEIVDAGGKVLGTHAGLQNYTLGQREGLGIATGVPLYVVGLDRAANRLVVGERTDAMVDRFPVRNVTWTDSPDMGNVLVKVRHRSKAVSARVSAGEGGNVTVDLMEPQFAPAPGQSAVFYRGEEVLGGGIITR